VAVLNIKSKEIEMNQSQLASREQLEQPVLSQLENDLKDRERDVEPLEQESVDISENIKSLRARLLHSEQIHDFDSDPVHLGNSAEIRQSFRNDVNGLSDIWTKKQEELTSKRNEIQELRAKLQHYANENHDLCTRCSHIFVLDERVDVPACDVLVSEIRLNVKCAFCRLLDSILPFEEITKIRIVLSHGSYNIYHIEDERVKFRFGFIDLPWRSDDKETVPSYTLDSSISRSSSMINFEVIKQYIVRCNQQYCQDEKHQNPRYGVSTDINLVDIVQMCLVGASTSKRFIALSYVWGEVSGLQYTSMNKERLEKPASLEHLRGDLPLLVLDAIELVRKLGERYLWVDSLCIEQDNPTHKHNQISQMDIIYRRSLMTIIALSSNKSSDALPGVFSRSIRPIESTEIIRGVQITSSCDISSAIVHNVYESRGWTFQERLLSPRCLLMTEFGPIYHCENGHSDQTWEKLVKSRALFSYESFENDLRVGGKLNSQSYYSLYESLVQRYTKRNLTFPSDAVNAFTGILAMLGSVNLGEIQCALPEKFLSRAMHWCPVISKDFKRNPFFASWSWAGWIGQISYNGEMDSAHSYWNQNLFILEFDLDPFYITSFRHSSWMGKRPLWTKSSASESRAEDREIAILRFTAETALANQVSIRPSKHQHYPQLHLHRENTGQRIGYLCCIEEMLTSAQQQLFGEYKDGPQEFIKLSKKGSGGIYVLLIGCPKDGPAERLAIGFIDLGAWNLLNRTTKRIKLG
jgi:hypothetical protein